MKKRILSLLIVLCLVTGMIPAASAAEVASGTCGENLTWVLADDGTLTIFGEGEMRSFFDVEEWYGDGYDTIRVDAPWYDHVEDITSLIINEGVTSIGGEAFYAHSKLAHVELPSTLLTIGKNAFAGCRSLTSVTLPYGLQSIGTEAFSNCSNMSNVSLPDGLQSIGENAFRYCDSLTDIILPGSLVEWAYAFRSCGLKTVTICDGVSAIPHHALSGCSALEHVTIPSSVKTIGQSAFSDCDNLAEIELPHGVEEIEKYAFIRCGKLEKITLPDTLKTIGDSAFESCSKLESITIPSSVTQIGNEVLNSPNLKAIHVDEDNPYFSSDPIGVFYNKDKTELIQFPSGLDGYYAIPEGVVSLRTRAFSYAYINALSIPVSVTAFGSSTFFYNYSYTIQDIYYAGTPEQWQLIECAYYDSGYNDGISESRKHYNSTSPEEHPYTPSVLAPTCTDQGYTIYTCACGHSYISDHIDALGHNYANGTCTRCGEADPDHSPVQNPFTDVPAGSFYEAPVLWALENGITTGATETSFDPNGQCLRAHVVTFLHRAAENPEPGSANNPFTDVKTTDFFYKPVLWAVEEKITNGVSADKFGSYDVCNRAAVVTFLWRAAGEPEPESADNPFTDVKPTDFFYKPVLWAVENGITNGLSATEFGPDSPCNRAQVVTFLYRAYN